MGRARGKESSEQDEGAVVVVVGASGTWSWPEGEQRSAKNALKAFSHPRAGICIGKEKFDVRGETLRCSLNKNSCML